MLDGAFSHSQTKSDHDVAANRTQGNLDRQRKHIEESVKKMTKAASGKGGDQKKSSQVSSFLSDLFFLFPVVILALFLSPPPITGDHS